MQPADGKLILPEGVGQLAAPAEAIRANEVRRRTLVPCIFQRSDWVDFYEVERLCTANWLIENGHIEEGSELANLLAPNEFFTPGGMFDIRRSHHLVMHVMAKGTDTPLCRCKAPEKYPVLRQLTQGEHQQLVQADAQAPTWHRLIWCRFCPNYAGWLTAKAA